MQDTTMERFFKDGRLRRYSAGEVVLDGVEPSGAFYIYRGYVKVYSIGDDGSRYVHIIYKPGEMFPLIWILKGIRRRVFYEAVSEAELFEVPKQEFTERMQKDSKLCNETLRQLAEQFYIYADRLDNLQYKSAYERVVYRLLFLAGRFGQRRSDGIIINIPATHELIAESINLARESVSRQVEKLEKRELLSYERGHLVLHDVEALSREFSEPVSLDLWGLETIPAAGRQ